jgi:hypothetical protein
MEQPPIRQTIVHLCDKHTGPVFKISYYSTGYPNLTIEEMQLIVDTIKQKKCKSVEVISTIIIDESAMVLASLFGLHNKTVEFVLFNNCGSVPNCIIDAFKFDTTVKVLNLCQNTVDTIALATMLEQNQSIVELDISGVKHDGFSLPKLGSMLDKNNSLRTLKMNQTVFDRYDAHMFLKSVKYLEELSLNSSTFLNNSATFFNMLRTPNLKKISLQNCRLNSDDVKVIASITKNCSNIVDINLEGNFIKV